VKRWRFRRQPGEPAIVVACPIPTTRPCCARHELLRFAAQNNLDLIVQTNPSVVINRLALAFVPAEGESLLPPASNQDLISPPASYRCSYRNWGLNE